ncbi:MAG: beta-lactamase family protein [Xanthomonadales bacterium]|nr:beta-lactamase family protein [Xanthomonadales bacterium]
MFRQFFVVFMLLMTSAGSAMGPEAQEVMQQRIVDYFETYKGNDPDAYAAWLKDNRTREAYSMAPLDARLEMYSFDAERWGGLELSEIEFPEPTLGVAEARPVNGGMPVRVTFQFEDEEPFLIGPMMVGIAFDVPQNWSDLDSFTQQVIDESGIPALAIGVMKEGEIIAQAVRGRKMLGQADVVQSNDTFHWGSITKSVTGTMIAKLIENGDLDWGTTIAEVLGDIPMRDEYRNVTISQLMSHEAGIQQYNDFSPEMVDEIVAAAKGDRWQDKRRAFVSRVLMEEPLAPPGEVHAYSNAGITIAGYMAEVVTGKSWRALIEAHVFRPYGMTTAGFDWPASPERPNQPVGHWGDSAANYEAMEYGQMEDLINILAPAGNIRSSIADLMRYGNAHLEGMSGKDGYLRAETVKRLHTARPDAVPWGDSFYTWGWGHNECGHFFDAPKCQAHNGGAGTFYAEIKLIPGRNMVLAYMANAAEPSEAIAAEVLAAVYEHYAK